MAFHFAVRFRSESRFRCVFMSVGSEFRIPVWQIEHIERNYISNELGYATAIKPRLLILMRRRRVVRAKRREVTRLSRIFPLRVRDANERNEARCRAPYDRHRRVVCVFQICVSARSSRVSYDATNDYRDALIKTAESQLVACSIDPHSPRVSV